jgi:hypothetical protein
MFLIKTQSSAGILNWEIQVVVDTSGFKLKRNISKRVTVAH